MKPLNDMQNLRRLVLPLAFDQYATVWMKTRLTFASNEEATAHSNLIACRMGATPSEHCCTESPDGVSFIRRMNVPCWTLQEVAEQVAPALPVRIVRVDDFEKTSPDFVLGPSVAVHSFDGKKDLEWNFRDLFNAALVKAKLVVDGPVRHYEVIVALDAMAAIQLETHSII